MASFYVKLSLKVFCFFLVGQIIGNVVFYYKENVGLGLVQKHHVFHTSAALESRDSTANNSDLIINHVGLKTMKSDSNANQSGTRSVGPGQNPSMKTPEKLESQPSIETESTPAVVNTGERKLSLKDLVFTNIPPKAEQFGGKEIIVSSAFLDLRFRRHFIRAFLLTKNKYNLTVTCHVTLDKSTHIAIKGEIGDIDSRWPPDMPYIAKVVHCLLPSGISNPSHVTLTVDQASKGVALQLIKSDNSSRPSDVKGPRVGACVKSLTGELPAEILIEWIEFHKLLGVHSFIVHNATLKGKANRVLDYYRKAGIIEVLPFPLYTRIYELAGNLSRGEDYSTGQQATLISIQDCLYRSVNAYEFTLLVDLDEFLTPWENEDLLSMVKRAYKETPAAAALTFRTGWYFTDFDKLAKLSQENTTELLMASRRVRTPVGKVQPKSIFHTERFLTGNWHGVVKLSPDANSYISRTVSHRKYGYVHHFRGECISKFYEKDCKRYLKNYEVDTVLPRYVSRLIQNVKATKQKLGIT